MTKPTSRCRWSLLAMTALVLSTLACRTPTEEKQLATEVADLRATRDLLSTELADLEGELPDAPAEATRAPTATPTDVPPTLTPTTTPTPVPPTATPALAQFSLTLLGCSTGLDITHGLGEVTNAYVRVQNWGTVDATNVCLRLEASDVGETHPDETRCVPYLPTKTQVALKLTVDTESGTDTAIAVHLTSDEGVTGEVNSTSCRELDLPLRREVEDLLDVVEPLSQD